MKTVHKTAVEAKEMNRGPDRQSSGRAGREQTAETGGHCADPPGQVVTECTLCPL